MHTENFTTRIMEVLRTDSDLTPYADDWDSHIVGKNERGNLGRLPFIKVETKSWQDEGNRNGVSVRQVPIELQISLPRGWDINNLNWNEEQIAKFIEQVRLAIAHPGPLLAEGWLDCTFSVNSIKRLSRHTQVEMIVTARGV